MTDQDWKRRHYQAMRTPNVREMPYVNIMKGVERYVTTAEMWSGGAGQWRDGVLGEGVADILKGFRVLLNGDLGRLDGGLLDQWVTTTAARIGWDLDRDRWADEEGPSCCDVGDDGSPIVCRYWGGRGPGDPPWCDPDEPRSDPDLLHDLHCPHGWPNDDEEGQS